MWRQDDVISLSIVPDDKIRYLGVDKMILRFRLANKVGKKDEQLFIILYKIFYDKVIIQD